MTWKEKLASLMVQKEPSGERRLGYPERDWSRALGVFFLLLILSGALHYVLYRSWTAEEAILLSADGQSKVLKKKELETVVTIYKEKQATETELWNSR